MIAREDPQSPLEMHTHEFSEIVIITGGSGVHVADGDQWVLSAGDVFVIGGDRPHHYVDTDHLRLINVLFDSDSLEMPLQDLATLPGYNTLFHLEPAARQRHQFESRLRISSADMHEVCRLVDCLENELKMRERGFRFIAMATFMQLVGHLSRCYGRTKNLDSQSLLQIAEVIGYIEKNYSKPISLDELVDISGLSRRSFSRVFESSMGCTPISHLIELRISRACELLKNTERSITEIAFDVGFNDSNYFARQFRKILNVSPSTYRQSAINPGGSIASVD
ncbi:HTH-type transcriptional activator RhaS [Rubripirellula obstinata]|uniref:HTH-type transcriptional activator RhaS n=1 Tax=Rubripirellula obstinata TaxID=406547 RepID=A0A5B1CNY4_9BACT|nr:helix-turn-helix domain-containing protein [Rubripirellula obstinata]KAA1261310.1 HTH-type transcriptional activator RhaS [Rubripirellula obstinata]